MVHAHNIEQQDLYDMYNNGIRMVRFCINPKNIDSIFDYIKIAKKIGFIVCVNVTRISSLQSSQILNYAKIFNTSGADVFYLADSNGSTRPVRIGGLFTQLYALDLNMELGFHAHNNMFLALTNAVIAVEAKATYIDSSLAGMGKGAGNLGIFDWLAYLNSKTSLSNYDLSTMIPLLEQCIRDCNMCNPEHEILDTIFGIYDLSIEMKSDPFFKKKKLPQETLNYAQNLSVA